MPVFSSIGQTTEVARFGSLHRLRKKKRSKL